MSKILFTHSYFYRFDPKQWENQTPYPPLGTIYAASMMRDLDYDVSLLDVGLEKDTNNFQLALSSEQPNYVVIYDDGFNYLTKMCLTNMRAAAFDMIEMSKKKDAVVIVCSSDASDHALKYMEKGADFVIYGEGEITLAELIHQIEAENEITSIEGLYRREENGNVIKNKSRKVKKNLDDFPLPAWDLIDVERYRRIWEKGGKQFTLNIATTRGCPYKCNWCAKPIYGQRYNSHSPQRIVEIVKLLKREYGVTKYWMCDDIFGLKKSWVQEFRDLLKKENLEIEYFIQSRADLLLQEDNIQALAESGLKEVWIGAESGSQKILDAMDKGTTIEQIEEATQKLKKHHIRVAFFIQFGYLGEEKKDIDLTIKMIQRLFENY